MVGTTQSRILELLKRDGPQPSRTLAATLGMTSAGVRQHLVTLERDGWVQRATVRGGRGRPRHAYGLTRDAEARHFPQGYADLACDLLDELHATGGPDAVQRLLRARMETRAARDASRLAPLSPEERLEAVAGLQAAAGYMAHAEVERGELVQRHCCIADAARRFPVVCALEQEWIERLLGTRVERTAYQPAGDHACRYRVLPAEGDDRCS